MTRRVLHLAVSALIFGAALWWVSFDDVVTRLQSLNRAWLLLALVGLILSTFSMARRWQITARALGMELPFGLALKEYFLSLALNALVPGGVVGDVSRAFRLRGDADLGRAATSVIAERLLGQAALFVILVIGVALSLLSAGGIKWPPATPWLLVLGISAAALFVAGTARAKLTADFTRFCADMLKHPLIVLHALFAAGLLIFALYACARATGTQVPLDASISILPLVLCAMLIPLSVAGWGWREGAAAALFPLFGASAEAGVAMGICYGSVMLLAALPGITVILTSPADKSALERS